MKTRLGVQKLHWTPRLVARYAVLQLPAQALVVLTLLLGRPWVDLPSWFFWGFIICWVLKDVILFPFVWRAYDGDRSGRGDSMDGLRGTAVEPLAPSGYVRVRGELWRAEMTGGRVQVEAGEAVLVRGTRGLTLLVEAEEGTLPGAASNKPDAPR
jgi:membrane protein implicated in regulation of membrane protease activity